MELFPNKNKQGFLLLERESMHSIKLGQMTLSDGQILKYELRGSKDQS